MGWGADGQLGLGPESSSDRAVPTLIERLSWKAKGKEVGRIKQISSSTDFTLALTENNQLWIWGNAEYGQCMVNKKIDRVSLGGTAGCFCCFLELSTMRKMSW